MRHAVATGRPKVPEALSTCSVPRPSRNLEMPTNPATRIPDRYPVCHHNRHRLPRSAWSSLETMVVALVPRRLSKSAKSRGLEAFVLALAPGPCLVDRRPEKRASAPSNCCFSPLFVLLAVLASFSADFDLSSLLPLWPCRKKWNNVKPSDREGQRQLDAHAAEVLQQLLRHQPAVQLSD